MTNPQVVLITGCSSGGIGAALAEEFHGRGHVVYATGRRLEALQPLAERGLHTLCLDVNDPSSIANSAEVVRRDQTRLDILVNNAGFGLFGAMTDLGTEDLRRQFETNVIATLAVTNAFVPMMRARRQGCIVNIGSMSGIVTTPFAGAYCASKAAVHALSDALRIELAPFGINVVIVQPGWITSRFGDSATFVMPEGSPYVALATMMRAPVRAAQSEATPTKEFARAMVDSVLRPSPPAVVRIGKNSKRYPMLKRWLPTALLDRVLSRRLALDKLGAG